MGFPRLLQVRAGGYNPHETSRMRELDGVELASFTRRASAFAIDFLILLIVALALLAAGLWVYKQNSVYKDKPDLPIHIVVDNEHNEDVLHWVVELGIPFLYWGLFTYGLNGRTPGKWLVGIRVVSLAHEKIRFWQSVERAIGYSVSGLEFGFGFLQFFLNANHRTAHDKLAETIVVRERWRKKSGKQEKNRKSANGLRYFETGW